MALYLASFTHTESAMLWSPSEHSLLPQVAHIGRARLMPGLVLGARPTGTGAAIALGQHAGCTSFLQPDFRGEGSVILGTIRVLGAQ